MTDKPFAITLDVGTSRANHTGSWRTERPEYVHRAAALRPRVPGRRGRPELALPRRGGRLRGRLATDHGGQPAPGGHGSRLLPPVRDGLQPRAARRGGRHQLRRALPRRRGAAPGLGGRAAGAALRPPRARGRRRALRALGRLPPDAARARGRGPRRRPARRRDDALRHPRLPAAARRPRRRGRAHRGDGRDVAPEPQGGRPPGHDGGRAVRRRVRRRRRAPRQARLRPGRVGDEDPRRGLAAARDGGPGAPEARSAGRGLRRRRHGDGRRADGQAPRRRGGGRRLPPHARPHARARRGGRGGHRGGRPHEVALDDQARRRRALRPRAHGARRAGLPAAHRRARGARGRLARARAGAGERPLAAGARARHRARTTAWCGPAPTS